MRATTTSIALAALLTACGAAPPGVTISSPLLDVAVVERPEAAPAASCVVESVGRVVLPPGATLLQCGPRESTSTAADPVTRGERPAASEHMDAAPGDPAPDTREGRDAATARGGPGGKKPSPAAPPTPLADDIRAAEGQPSNVAYCDPAGLHIGDGFRIALSDAEREALLCQAIEQARTEAERTIGVVWNTLDQVRRDVWIETCYWSVCSGFDDAIAALRRHDYFVAGAEILDSCLYEYSAARCGDIDYSNPLRARRLARWMVDGVRD